MKNKIEVIDNVGIIKPHIFTDIGESFFEYFSEKNFNTKVREIKFVQDNESRLSYGVIQ